MSVIEITNTTIDYLVSFLQNDIPETFRYFQHKTAQDIIKYHIKTLLYREKDVSMGYAHIDYDVIHDSYWFGICVLSPYSNQGIGTTLIRYVLDFVSKSSIRELYLTVDKTNTIAYHLYQKHGFTVKRETERLFVMSVSFSNLLYVPVSAGEAIDKLTILDIKRNKIHDSRQKDIQTEFTSLYREVQHMIPSIEFYYECLTMINLSIWDDQDTFRDTTDENEKYRLCTQIIEDNDARFRVKHKINHQVASFLKEQKGYQPKQYIIYDSMEDRDLLHSIIIYQSMFHDAITVYSTHQYATALTSLFSYDSSITIIPQDTLSFDSAYLETLHQDIHNKRVFQLIQKKGIKKTID